MENYLDDTSKVSDKWIKLYYYDEEGVIENISAGIFYHNSHFSEDIVS